MANSKVTILGTDYEIVVKKYSDDEAFERRSIDGYCDYLLKQIVICDMTTYKGWEKKLKSKRYGMKLYTHFLAKAVFRIAGFLLRGHGAKTRSLSTGSHGKGQKSTRRGKWQTQFKTGKHREVQRFLYNVRPRRIGAKEKENE